MEISLLNTGKQNYDLNGLSQRWNKTERILSCWITPLPSAVFDLYQQGSHSGCIKQSPLFCLPSFYWSPADPEKNMKHILVHVSFTQRKLGSISTSTPWIVTDSYIVTDLKWSQGLLWSPAYCLILISQYNSQSHKELINIEIKAP